MKRSSKKGLRARYEEFHGVRYTDPALRAAADLAAKQRRIVTFADKASTSSTKPARRYGFAGWRRQEQKKCVRRTLRQVIAKMAKIPPKFVSADDKTQLQNLDAELKRKSSMGGTRRLIRWSRRSSCRAQGARQSGTPVRVVSCFSRPDGCGQNAG